MLVEHVLSKVPGHALRGAGPQARGAKLPSKLPPHLFQELFPLNQKLVGWDLASHSPSVAPRKSSGSSSGVETPSRSSLVCRQDSSTPSSSGLLSALWGSLRREAWMELEFHSR